MQHVKRSAAKAMGILRTPPGKAFAPARDRGIYVVWIALVWAGMLAGFLPDLARFEAETPAPPLVLHVHAALYFVWLVCVTLQIAFVELRRPALHRRLGWWLVGLSVALVPLGLVSTMVDMARSSAGTPYEPQFLGLEFQSLIVFSILLGLATQMRRDIAAHRRLMILLAICFLDPGTSRAWGFFSPIHPDGMFGWWLRFFWGNAAMLLAMMGWDIRRHGRVHPALLAGGALITAGEVAAVFLEFSPWWHRVAGGLVMAWGWTG
ncbi:hypothetical protein HZF05_09450 [Sphingomonas sp. CGMCC 1.13654]|uniref:DUF2306 domain-containing protein n=1 Tax=Sphingomonas chungangi TaxID=2683589 RepID=A0A838L6N8_9SPHN|nr:hypothetical protein [Sphingomonas chungangi]MBA2934322.1 hypothetical protein [Sphingomonas chungangi]MVW57363.1 hypothetical protein [Sphingomonas chungangi]